MREKEKGNKKMIIKRNEYERLKKLEMDYNEESRRNKVLATKLSQKSVELRNEIIEHSKTKAKLGKAVEILEKNHIQYSFNYKK